MIEKLTKIHDGVIQSKYNYRNTLIVKNPKVLKSKIKKEANEKTFYYYKPKRRGISKIENGIHYKSTLPNISKLKLDERSSDKEIHKPETKFNSLDLANNTDNNVFLNEINSKEHYSGKIGRAHV